jgi:hypothetical protein
VLAPVPERLLEGWRDGYNPVSLANASICSRTRTSRHETAVGEVAGRTGTLAAGFILLNDSPEQTLKLNERHILENPPSLTEAPSTDGKTFRPHDLRGAVFHPKDNTPGSDEDAVPRPVPGVEKLTAPSMEFPRQPQIAREPRLR